MFPRFETLAKEAPDTSLDTRFKVKKRLVFDKPMYSKVSMREDIN